MFKINEKFSLIDIALVVCQMYTFIRERGHSHFFKFFKP